MIFQNDTNFYQILEIRPDASSQDIRNAYLRLKSSYRKDNPALYSVLDTTETEEMIHKIEEAFQILSDPDTRRDYDERNGFTDRIERKIFSLDRPTSSPGPIPPSAPIEFDPLIAPKTDFSEETSTRTGSGFLPTQATRDAPSFLETLPATDHPPVNTPRRPDYGDSKGFLERRQNANPLPSVGNSPVDAIAAEIANETEWRGSTLRRIRELRRYSLDDVASLTKISKNYLHAIEDEVFTKLPAQVFVRGFLLQFARVLKIPPESVASAYLARLGKRQGGA